MRQLARFSSKYEELLAWEKREELLRLPSWETLRTDWWTALLFFLNRAFYQGRSDSVSSAFREATNKALAELLPAQMSTVERADRVLEWHKAQWLCRANWSHQDNPVRRALDQKYVIELEGSRRSYATGKARDREMVLDILRFICEHPAGSGRVLNIAAYAAALIEEGETSTIYGELDDIWQVGPKITAFFLRDLVAVLNLQSRLTSADYRFLQPIDTWIERIARRLNIQAGPEGLAAAIVNKCQQEGVDPIRFNQGAWYLGAHSFDVVLENLERIEP